MMAWMPVDSQGLIQMRLVTSPIFSEIFLGSPLETCLVDNLAVAAPVRGAGGISSTPFQ